MFDTFITDPTPDYSTVGDWTFGPADDMPDSVYDAIIATSHSVQPMPFRASSEELATLRRRVEIIRKATDLVFAEIDRLAR